MRTCSPTASVTGRPERWISSASWRPVAEAPTAEETPEPPEAPVAEAPAEETAPAEEPAPEPIAEPAAEEAAKGEVVEEAAAASEAEEAPAEESRAKKRPDGGGYKDADKAGKQVRDENLTPSDDCDPMRGSKESAG